MKTFPHRHRRQADRRQPLARVRHVCLLHLGQRQVPHAAPVPLRQPEGRVRRHPLDPGHLRAVAHALADGGGRQGGVDQEGGVGGGRGGEGGDARLGGLGKE